MSNVEALYAEFAARLAAELETETDPAAREALADCICTCRQRIAAERARLAQAPEVSA